MIRVLGTKRVLVLVMLIAFNAALAASVYLYLSPAVEKKEREMRALKGQISSKQGDISRMQVEFDKLAEQQNRFEQLKGKGFFFNQDRRQAEIVLENIQKQAGVISARAEMQAGVIEENEEAKKAEYNLLKSQGRIHIEALDAVDIYRYLYFISYYFPGHVTFKDIAMERKSDVTGPILRAIASGSNPPLVQADVELIWRTMIPKSEVIGAAAEPNKTEATKAKPKP